MKRFLKNLFVILIVVGLFCCLVSIVACNVKDLNRNKTETDIYAQTDNGKHTHSFSDWITVKLPNCTEDGVRERSCACGETETEILRAFGHDYIPHDGQSATCTDVGWREYRTCSRCDYSEYTEIPATGHDYGEWMLVREATCLTYGEEVRICSCDGSHTETRQLPLAAHTDNGWNTVKIADCETDGLKIKICPVCLEELDREVSTATGHNYGEWQQTSAPDCDNTGTETRYCKNNPNHVESREITALGHSYAWIADEDAHREVCAECGDSTESLPHEWESGVCSVCGYEERIAENELDYLKDGNFYTVTGIGTVTGTDIVIPSVYKGLPVTAIAPEAFYGCTNLKTVELSDCIEIIGEGAFSHCENLTDVILSENLLRIEDNSFSYCSKLKSLIIPAKVEFIGFYAFLECAVTEVEFKNKQGWEFINVDGKCDGICNEAILENHEYAASYLKTYIQNCWKRS